MEPAQTPTPYYKILLAGTTIELAARVNRHLAAGYTLLGGPFSGGTLREFAQAVIFHDASKRPRVDG